MTIQEIFKEYRQKKDIDEISIDQMKADLGPLKEKIVLYGAGSAGIAFLHYLRDIGVYPKYFADGNPQKWGTVCEEIPVIDYHKIKYMLGEDALVIVTINTDGTRYCKSFDEALRKGGHSGVHKNLHDAGCKHVIDYTYFRRCRKLFRGDMYNLPSCSDVYLMEENEENLEKVYSMMADEYSKDVLKKLIYFRLLDDTIRIPTEPQDRQYFEYNFYPKRKDEVFVDCGAYNGISLKAFLKENQNQFESYYGIEPDEENYKKLKEYVETLPKNIRERIILDKTAVYDRQGMLTLYELKGPGSFISNIGKAEVKAEKIDTILEHERATYIKMNIEGSELPALHGARQTIEEYKPRLAIAGYHKTWDLWEIPLLIHDMCSDYKLYLRSYMNHVSFVYYGA